MSRRSYNLALVSTLLALSLAATARAQNGDAATPTSPSAMTPGRAARLSIVPGLGQHYMGDHGKALFIEGAVVTGIVLVAAGGKSSSSDGGGDYVPPAGASRTIVPRFAAPRRVDGGDGSGSGDGNGDGSGTSTTRIIGTGMIIGGVAWSIIDASISARRIVARSAAPANDRDARLGLNLIPSFSGVTAGISLTF